MKKFRKILSYFILFFAFCLVCMGIVHADTMFITQTYTPLQNCLNSGVCTDESDFWNNILNYNDLIQEDSENDYYTIYYTFENDTLYYVRSNNPLYVRYDYNNGIPTISLRFVSTTVYWNEISYSFNSSGEITGVTRNSSYNYTGTDTFGITAINSTFSSIILATNQDNYLYNYTSSPNNSIFSIQGISGTFDIDDTLPINFTNGTTYHWNTRDIFTPLVTYCEPDNYLGQMSNVSDFTITIKGTTNALSEYIMGSFDIISNKTMTESDWQLSFNHTPDDIISTGSLSCTANRCVFHFLTGVEDDIDEEITLNYKFTSSSMPTKIQIDTCNNNNLDLKFSYTYTNNDTNTNTNPDNTIITDDTNMNNWMQDGSLPDYSGLSDTSIIPDGPVDAILTLPLNVMNSLLNVLNSNTCQPLVLPLPFTNGQNLTLPCVSTLYAKVNGLNVFLNWFSAIFSAFILYQYFINLYKWVDDTLTFRENNHFGGY